MMAQTVRLVRMAKTVTQAAFYVLIVIAIGVSVLVRASGLDHPDAATGRTFKIEYGKGGEFPIYVRAWEGETMLTLAILALTTGIMFAILRLAVRRIDKT